MGASILRSEFDAAIRDLKRNKAPGIDDIPAELIKYAGEKTLTRLYKTICDIYLTEDMLTFIAFVDLEKAFDNVDWNSMFRILKEIGVLYNDRKIVHSLYINQVAVIKSGTKCDEARIKKGVRKGCALSPVIFNVYIEKSHQRNQGKGSRNQYPRGKN